MNTDPDPQRQLAAWPSREPSVRLTLFDYVDMLIGPLVIGLLIGLLVIVLA
jgi:hypothetical protein